MLLAAGATAALALAAPPACTAAEWAWPVRGRVITSYSNDNTHPYAGGMHRGIDIGAPVGTRVGAAGAGRVTYAGALGTSGLVVAVETSDRRYATSYLHLSRIAVAKGDEVGAGQELGEVGTSGRPASREPHLHFGVRLAGRKHFYVDPLTLLPSVNAGRPGAQALSAPAPERVRAQAAPVRVRARPALRPVPAGPALAPVPAGPRAIRAPATIPARAAAAPVPHTTHRPRPAAGSIAWGPLVSLAGLLLLGGVLALRLQGASGSRRGEHGAQPATRAAAVGRLGSVSQVG
jgi:peptidase M23-like protein